MVPRRKLTAEELHRLHWDEGLSQHEMAQKLGVSQAHISHRMRDLGVAVRSQSEAQLNISTRRKNPEEKKSIAEQLDDIIKVLENKIPVAKYKYTPREDTWLALPLKWYKQGKKENRITLTLCMSDLHLGDCNHLPKTFWSTLDTAELIINILKTLFSIKHFSVICNGDVVSGREVYRYQMFRNLLPRGHWQVFLAESVLTRALERLQRLTRVHDIYFTKGTHEALAENYILYLKKYFKKAKYCGMYVVLNIGKPLGNYNVLVTHGAGRSEYYPVSYTQIRSLWKSVNQYKLKGIPVERCLVGHSHWLTTNLELEGLTVDETGGFQQWEQTIQQRPCGMILYIYYDGEVTAVPVRPLQDIEISEKMSSDLEYHNMLYYAQMLQKHYERDVTANDAIEAIG